MIKLLGSLVLEIMSQVGNAGEMYCTFIKHVLILLGFLAASGSGVDAVADLGEEASSAFFFFFGAFGLLVLLGFVGVGGVEGGGEGVHFRLWW